MRINRLSGYTEITLSSGHTQGLKFCNGSLELFAKAMGIVLLSDLDKALSCPVVDNEAQPTAYYYKALRLYVYSAARYVCLAENQPVTFNEWQAAEWLEQYGTGLIWNTVESNPQSQDSSDTDTDSEDTAQSLLEFKFDALARLNLSPPAYYDLTQAETIALLKGENERKEFALWQTRRIATLIRNGSFTKPVSEEEFMPLPSDKKTRPRSKKEHTMPPHIFIQLLNDTFSPPTVSMGTTSALN